MTSAGEDQVPLVAEVRALRGRVESLQRAEQALQDSEQRYRALFEQAADSIVLFDADSKEMIEFNDVAASNLGYTREEFASLSLVDIAACESAQQITQHIEQVELAGSDSFETKHRKKTGELRDILVSAKVICVQGRKLVASIWRDITDRKQVEEALRRERDFSARLLQASPTFFVALNATGQTLMMNEVMLSSLGYTEEEVVGTNYLETFVPPSDRPLLAEVFSKLVSWSEPTLNENRVLAKDGRELLVEWHGMPIFKENQEFDFFFGVGIDITQRRREEKERQALEAQMQHAQKLESLGVLAGGIAHDFNNLLVSVLGNASLVLQTLPPNSPERQLVKEIERSACRAADLTKQMLAYSGRGKFIVAPISFSELVEEMTHLLKVSISKKAVLELEFPGNLPAVEADATQVRQVVMNLITNASEALGDQGGVITVRTGVMDADRAYLSKVHLDDHLPEGPYTFVEVSDSGCGMSPEVQANIFDPFFTTKMTGRGLGLAAVMGIVRSHGGGIRVNSTPGQGTAIRVLFPISKLSSVTVAHDERTSGERRRGAGTILVVDDEDDVCSVARRMLEQSGFTVLTAHDGREALHVFREHAAAIDAVVLDMTMPDLGGEEVFQQLRSIHPDVRVVLSSGYNEHEATDRLTGVGVAAFLQKPYRSDTLIEKLEEIMNT